MHTYAILGGRNGRSGQVRHINRAKRVNVLPSSRGALPNLVAHSEYHGKKDPSSIEVKVYTKIEDLRTIWSTMESGPCFPFQRYAFVLEWCRIIGPAINASPKIFLVCDAEGPLALFPMCVVREKSLNFLEFMDGGVSDYNVPLFSELARDHGLAFFDVAWKRILGLLPEVDAIRLRKLPSELFGIPNPMLQLRCSQEEGSGHFLDLQTDLMAARSLIREAAKKHRQLCQAHTVVIEDGVGDRETLTSLIGFRDAKYRWQPPHRDAIIQFYQGLLERAGLVKMFCVSIDGHLAAAQYALVSGDTCIGLVIGYDQPWAKFSPGRILIANMLARLKERGFSIFDSGYGTEKYKAEFSPGRRILYSYYEGISLQGRLYIRLRSLVRQGRRAWPVSVRQAFRDLVISCFRK